MGIKADKPSARQSQPADPVEGRWSARIGTGGLVAAVCVLALVGSVNTLWNDFACDDLPIIVHNPLVSGPGGLGQVWTTDYWGPSDADPHRDLLYRPLAVSTYRLDYMVWGLRPFGFHLTNIILHAAVAGLVVALARRLGCPPAAALVAGVFFAVMPVHTEAVANVVGRAEILAALFVVAAILSVLQLRRTTGKRRVWLWAITTTLCMAGAIFSKENGAVAVVLVPLFALLGGSRTSEAGRTDAVLSRPAAGLIVCLLAGLVLAGGLFLRYQALDGQLIQTAAASRMTNMLVEATPAGRFWGAFQLFGLHLAKTFVPATLCMDYSYKAIDPAVSPANLHVIIGLAGFAALVGGMVLAWRNGRRGLALCGLALLISYLPVSNSVLLIKIWFAERLWYLPSVFLSLLLGFVAVRAAEHFGRRQLAGALLAVVALAGLARGWVRNAEWRDDGVLFASAYQVHPNSAQVLCCYGSWLVNNGQLDDGIGLLGKAVRLAPEYTTGHLGLARAYLKVQQYDAAAIELQTVLMSRPGDQAALALRDEVAARLAGQYEKRIELMQRKYQDEPNNLQALVELSEALSLLGRTEQAQQLFEEAQDRFAGSAEFHRAHGVLTMTLGRRNEAIAAYRSGLALQPDHAECAVELSMALLDRRNEGDFKEAGELLERAAAMHPNHPQVMMARAEWLILGDRRDEALQLYRRTLEQTPPGELRNTLESRLRFLEAG